MFQRSRGWSADEWAAATERLRSRGLVDTDGRVTTNGREQRDEIERRTDELAIRPYEALGDDVVDALLAALSPAARTLASAGEITFPNPMGLPPVVS
jgi:hypothetical protein